MSALINRDLVVLDQDLGKDRFNVIDHLAGLVASAGRADSREGLFEDAKARESKTDTGIPGGIAIPHCRSAHVTEATLAMARPAPGVDFGAKDGPADLIFFIAAPDGADQEHLALLSKLARSLVKKAFVASLREATDPQQIVDLVDDALGLRERQDAPEAGQAASAPAAAGAAGAAGSTAAASSASGSTAPAASADGAGKRTRLVAVTACPTGIAHTYMAADSLAQEAEEMGVDLAVETQGSSGNEVLDQATIDAADAVIFAVSVDVRDRARFAGKPVVESPVKRGIDEPRAMIEEAVRAASDPSARRVSGEKSEDSSSVSDGTWGSRIYKSLMTGVSYMIPFVAAGGLLIALSFLIGGYDIALKAADILGIKDGSLTGGGATLFHPGDSGMRLYCAAVMYQIGSLTMSLLVPALAGFIAFGMTGRPGIAPGFAAGLVANLVGAGFLGGIVGGLLAGFVAYLMTVPKLPRWLAGMMPVVIIPLLATLISSGLMFMVLGAPIAWVMDVLNDFLTSMSGGSAILLGIILGAMMGFDLGGPVNKTAYLFATAGLASNTDASHHIMGAVIASGMVAPLAMALATTVRKRLFTPVEVSNGRAAWLLGASFISEGAIPFMAADPARVIPSSMIGSAVTGALCMAWNVGSPAPHGGIWILLLIQGPWAFLAAVIIGTLVSAGVYLLLKRRAGSTDAKEKTELSSVA